MCAVPTGLGFYIVLSSASALGYVPPFGLDLQRRVLSILSPQPLKSIFSPQLRKSRFQSSAQHRLPGFNTIRSLIS